ncbi:fkbM_fam, methyltransferase, FkbM family [Candidatus Pelagibacterales bacterium]
MLKSIIRNVLKVFNLRLSYYNHNNFNKNRLSKIIDVNNINIIFDIGSNEGQFGLELFQNDFKGKIISFEPTADAHFKLVKLSRSYPNWIVHERVALAEKNGVGKINVAGNSALSSSFLDMKSIHLESAPDSLYVSIEDTKIITLDSIFNNYVIDNDEVLIKLDVQGYEKQVLIGAINSIKKVRAVKLECSLVSLYEGDKTYEFYFDWLKKLGFTLFDLEAGHAHPVTGRLLQFDAVFVRQ